MTSYMHSSKFQYGYLPVIAEEATSRFESYVNEQRLHMANMLFNINDVVETIKGHSITNDIIEEYDASQFVGDTKKH